MGRLISERQMEWLMASEKTLYWMAVGVAALFLGSSFLGGRGLAPSIADRSMATAQRISGQAMRYATFAQVIFGRGDAGVVHTQTATASAQARLAVVQAAMARREAALARVQAERIRVLANREVAVCPRQNLVTKLPQIPGIVLKERSNREVYPSVGMTSCQPALLCKTTQIFAISIRQKQL